MDGELLCLKWRDHCSSLFRTLSSVRKKEVYCDATIACDGRFYPVHKFVLSTCSDYFEQMFEMGEQKNIMIVITDIGCEELETLLDYMYFGEVNVMQSDLNTFMKAAERLRIKGLAQKSECGEKRARGQKEEDDRDTKRRRWSEEVPLHLECSQSVMEGKSNNSRGRIGETSSESRNKDHSEPRKGRSVSSDVHNTSSLENTRLESDLLDLNASEHNAEVKLEPFNVKVEPEDWRHAEIVDDSSVFTSSEPTETYLRPSTPALPVGTSGLGAGDHGNTRNTHADNLGGSAQPLPGPSGLHSTQTWDHGSASIPLQSEEFSHFRAMANKGMGMGMGPRKTGRPTSDIWNHYKTEKSNGKNYVICIYCTTQKYGYPNATKMKIHTVKCVKCPENIRKQYKQELAQMVAKSEASKSVLLKQTPGFEAQGYS